jgi:hypothetical protein
VPALPRWERGRTLFLVLPEITEEVLQNHRNRGAITTGQSPWSGSIFIIGRITFSPSSRAIIFGDSGKKALHMPFLFPAPGRVSILSPRNPSLAEPSPRRMRYRHTATTPIKHPAANI